MHVYVFLSNSICNYHYCQHTIDKKQNGAILQKTNVMSKESIGIEEFKKILPQICEQDTSSDPDNWTEENPLYGHCAVVSLLAQYIFGGELLRASLEPYPKFKHMRSHYFNALPDGTVIDFTAPQFGNEYPEGMQTEQRTRTYVLENQETHKRYNMLIHRYFKKIQKPKEP